MKEKSDAEWLRNLLDQAKSLEPRMIEQTRELVSIESPSLDKQAVDRAVSAVSDWCSTLGGQIKLHRHKNYGDSLEVTFRPRRSAAPPLLLLGHLDTVWEHGTLRTMPCKLEGGRMHGPGVLDMKLGVVMGLHAVQLLREADRLTRPVVLLLHGDEEIGSPASRRVTEAVAKKCAAVYVLEPAQGEHAAYKTMRKGVGGYRVEVQGISAHSGVDFERGRSAVLELARQIEVIAGFTDLSRGLTVNPGVIGGGTRSNVVAAKAWVEVDVRVARKKDIAAIEKKMHSLRARDKQCVVTVSGGLNRPPMERTPAIVKLFQRAKSFALQINGAVLEEAATGGGSDGNFTAALGIPTLDGMGAVGAGAHADHEHAVCAYIAPRTALLAAMLQ
jgi:glutamate carboxypeptidase